MAKLSDMSVSDLYKRAELTLSNGKSVTATLAKAVKAKEDFTCINQDYCTKICCIPTSMKACHAVKLEKGKTDIVIIQNFNPENEKYKTTQQLSRLHNSIYDYLAIADNGVGTSSRFKGLTWKVLDVVKCEVQKYPDPKTKKYKKITFKQTEGCSPYLLEEIYQLDPKVIIATETHAVKVLGLPKCSSTKQRGQVHYITIKDKTFPVVITLHPKVTCMIRQNASGAMWGPDYYGLLARDFHKAAMLAKGEIQLRDTLDAIKELVDNGQIVVTRTLAEVKQWTDFLNNLSEDTIISWDTETSGLDPWEVGAKFLCHQFGYRREDGLIQAVVIPLWHRANVYNGHKAWPMVKSVLENDLLKVAHNAAFDLKYTRVTTDAIPNNVRLDTMLLLHSYNSGVQGNYSLKAAAWDFLLESGLGGYEDLLQFPEDELDEKK